MRVYVFNGFDEMNRAQIGHPVGYFYGLQTAGIFQNQEEINSYRSKEGKIVFRIRHSPGDVRFVDRNWRRRDYWRKNKTQIGNPNPTATYGFNFNRGI